MKKKNVDQDRAKESPVEKLEDLFKLMLFLEQGAQIQVCYTYSKSQHPFSLALLTDC